MSSWSPSPLMLTRRPPSTISRRFRRRMPSRLGGNSMSDVSVLSHEYKTASELSSTINRALITLKKASLHLQGAETTPPGQFEQSREVLAQVLESLAFHLKPAGDRTPDVSSTPEIPAALVARVRTE